MDWYGAARSLLADIAAEMDATAEHILAGSATDMEQYRGRVEYRRGLQRAAEMIHARLRDDEREALGIPPAGRTASPKLKG
jgi:ketosteroid isomerase-like protein